MKKNFCIVIPTHKEDIDITEEISLKRLDHIIQNKEYDVFLVTPNKVKNINVYNKTLKNTKFEQIKLDDKWFESMHSYNLLMIDYDFYDLFSNYEYMLIYQTDCYLFKDEIQKWCDKGYDYVGAPVLEYKYWDLCIKYQKPHVGNGGFSLRKISTFKNITNPNGEFRTYYDITQDKINNVEVEDAWYCNYVYERYYLNMPPWEEAMEFSLDINYKKFYTNVYFKLHDKELCPMGCHAWPKTIKDWLGKIDELTPEIIDFCEEKYKDFYEWYYDYLKN